MIDIDQRVIPVTIWRGRDDGAAPDPICTIEAMYYYPVTDTYNIILSDENIDQIHNLFTKRLATKRRSQQDTPAPKQIIEAEDYDFS